MPAPRGVLTHRGYALVKADLAPGELERLRAELSVVPQTGLPGACARPPPILAYRESDKKVYLPKAFGLSRYGAPAEDRVRLAGVTDVAVAFQGELRDQQREAVDAYLAAARDPLRQGGILSLPCGAGKTVIALCVVARLGVKTMIVAHKDFLLAQWRERLGHFVPAARLGLIKGPVCDVADRDVVLASLQSLSMKAYPAGTFRGFGLVVFDEVHRAATEVFSAALAKLSFAHTLGLSATVERKDGTSRVFKWHLGELAFAARRGADDEVRVWHLRYSCEDPEYRTEEYACNGRLNTSRLLNRVCAYEPRTLLISDVARDLVEREGRKVLVLSDRKAQLTALRRALEPVTAGLYVGGMSEEALQRSQACSVILATYSFASEGFDASDLDTLIMASPKTDIEQSVGRVLRTRPADRARVPLVVDVVDDLPMYLGQWRRRRTWYREQGYRIKCVDADENKDGSAGGGEWLGAG